MNKYAKWMNKYKWGIFAAFCVLTAVGLVFRVSYLVGRSLEIFAVKEYIVSEYMPTMRKANGKWPTELIDFPNQVEKTGAGLDYLIMKYYENNLIRIKSIQECDKSYVYRIFVDNEDMTCKATIDQDNGYCWSN